MSAVVGAGATHAGAVRDRNEDAWLADAERGLYLVADGMGGHAAGEVASALAVETVAAAWGDGGLRRLASEHAGRPDAGTRREVLAALREGVVAAHLAIARRGRERREESGMGTTFTGLRLAGDDAFFAHAGDSRAYLVRGGRLRQLSEDHTVSARLRAAGIGGPGQGDGVLTSALGVGDARVATFVLPACRGDRFVLCTDGVYQYFDGDELGEVAGGAASPARAAERLVKVAVARGGEDNATAVVADVIEGGPPERADAEVAAAARCALLSALSEGERLRALRIAVPQSLEAGAELWPDAGGARIAYVVVEGELDSGGERRGPGALVFAAALVAAAAVRGAPARAAGPARVLAIRQDDFSALVEDEPELGVKLYGALATLMATR